MAKKKSKKNAGSKKKSDKEKILKLKLKKRKEKKEKKKEAKKKEAKKKATKKKEAKKKNGKKKEVKKKDGKKKVKKEQVVVQETSKISTPEKVIEPKESAKPAELSSDFNARDAVTKLRTLKTREELLAFTKGEKRVTVIRVIPAALNRLQD